MGRTLSQCIQIPNHHILNNLQFFLYIAIKLKLKKNTKGKKESLWENKNVLYHHLSGGYAGIYVKSL